MLYHMDINQIKEADIHMNDKLTTLFDYLKNLCEADIDRIIGFVLGIIDSNQAIINRPNCPYCECTKIIKFGRRNNKQRFKCKQCKRTYMLTTNTLMANSHYGQHKWEQFIKDTLYGVSLDKSAENLGFSHQTAFNMRHKVLMALQDLLDQEPVMLSGVAELDETFVLDCYKGAPVPESAGRGSRKHGAKALKRGISNEYVAICTGIQRDGGVVAKTVNRAKPSCEELKAIFTGHIAKDALLLTDGLRSYNILESMATCTVVDVNHEGNRGTFNLNTVNGLHSYIKNTYDHYRGVATKYINRYNALFAIAYRCLKETARNIFTSLCNASCICYWHGVCEVRNHNLVVI